MMEPILGLQTPAALLEATRFELNCADMLARVRKLGTRLRPHMKTLKSIEAARVAIDPQHGGIAVATLNEARYFIGNGIRDVCYAVCPSPDKLHAIAELAATGCSFFIDTIELAQRLTGHEAPLHGAPFRVWIEVDCGEHRTGIEPDDAALVAVARLVEGCAHTELVGVATHAGQSYRCRSIDEIKTVARQERVAACEAAQRLRDAGFDIPQVSIGSSPTAVWTDSTAGITELRAGVYMAGDLVQSVLGTLPLDRVAFSVLATVTSVHPKQHRVIIDAGGLALSKDRGTSATARDYGYGLVLDAHGNPTYGELTITDVHQEHGEILHVPDDVMEKLSLGTKVRVIPNHVCMTAALYDNLNVVDSSAGVVTALWERTNGW